MVELGLSEVPHRLRPFVRVCQSVLAGELLLALLTRGLALGGLDTAMGCFGGVFHVLPLALRTWKVMCLYMGGTHMQMSLNIRGSNDVTLRVHCSFRAL